jgi:flagellar motor switch protein FliN/FliY
MMTRIELLKRIAAELSRVVGALVETSASHRPAAVRSADAFVVSFEATGGRQGGLDLLFGRDGAEALVRELSESQALPPDDQVLATLRDICTQAVAAVEHHDLGCTLRLVAARAGSMPIVDAAAPDEAPLVVDIVLNGHEDPLQVALTGTVDMTAGKAGSSGDHGKTLDVIMDIDLPLVVRFGRTELPLKALTALAPASVIDLGRSPDEPVDVLISNRVIARGKVVIVSGNYGVRVLDVVSPAERARSVEAELS